MWTGRPLWILGALALGALALRRLLRRQRPTAERRPDPGVFPEVVEVEAVPVGPQSAPPPATAEDPALEVEAAPERGDEVDDPGLEHELRHAEDAIRSRLSRDD